MNTFSSLFVSSTPRARIRSRREDKQKGEGLTIREEGIGITDRIGGQNVRNARLNVLNRVKGSRPLFDALEEAEWIVFGVIGEQKIVDETVELWLAQRHKGRNHLFQPFD